MSSRMQVHPPVKLATSGGRDPIAVVERLIEAFDQLRGLSVVARFSGFDVPVVSPCREVGGQRWADSEFANQFLWLVEHQAFLVSQRHRDHVFAHESDH